MSAPVAIPDIKKGEDVAAQAFATAKQMGEQLLAAQVTTAEQAQWATNAAHEVWTQKRALEAERDKVAKPLRKLATDHAKRWKPAIDVLTQCEQHLKTQALQFQQAERRRQAEALQAATNQTEVAAAVAVLAPTPVGLQERSTWAWEVTDLAKVPREYFVLDTARLDREARDQKGELAVPGIKPVCKTTAVLR